MPGYNKEQQTRRTPKPSKAEQTERDSREYEACVARATDRFGVTVCDWCGKRIWRRSDIHRHHVIPRSRGGPTHRDNLACVHGDFAPEQCHLTIHKAGAPGWEMFTKRYPHGKV